MTPKEKAIELVDKFTVVGLQQRAEGYQCAIIAVDEIMKVVSIYNDTQAEYYYWEEVQQEIEKL